MKKNEIAATGKRKESIAQVKMLPGKGNIIVNGKDVNEYMPFATLVMDIKQPLVLTNTEKNFDFNIKVKGGGFKGQAGAIRLGITKCLLEYDKAADQTREDAYRKILKIEGMITRDPRVKERKKYGLKKARKAPQFSKR